MFSIKIKIKLIKTMLYLELHFPPFPSPPSLAVMGQEAGKPTWPKPAGGYQTITGRRYGRRHAYVSFRPSLMNQERYSNQHTEECEGLELDSVLKENLLCVCHIITNYY